MRKLIIIVVALFIFSKTESAPVSTTIINSSYALPIEPVKPSFNISTAKVKDVEKLLGRKLKLKEKLAFKVYQWKLKKEQKQPKADTGSDKGKTSMILGIVGIGLLLLPYLALAAIPCAILAIIFGNQARKINRNDGKAKAGIILGWVTLGLIVLAIIIVAAILASWGGWGWG